MTVVYEDVVQVVVVGRDDNRRINCRNGRGRNLTKALRPDQCRQANGNLLLRWLSRWKSINGTSDNGRGAENSQRLLGMSVFRPPDGDSVTLPQWKLIRIALEPGASNCISHWFSKWVDWCSNYLRNRSTAEWIDVCTNIDSCTWSHSNDRILVKEAARVGTSPYGWTTANQPLVNWNSWRKGRRNTKWPLIKGRRK